MYMKIAYIRLDQDTSGMRGPGDDMQLGYDPPSHPTREWILGHLDAYQDCANPWIEVRSSYKGLLRTLLRADTVIVQDYWTIDLAS
ncbi:hypothetical protein PsorP6_006714 [Peronosclerospora sorghi]|uniref:Uncharacterized protein n=1 Tax=Peronosclerospora sorghi TaxID=230839 RepID=A0ACC0W5M2_9STRA|nr:hypothetical protein PsorP6_006714 [Peronosclerospora sorghi]